MSVEASVYSPAPALAETGLRDALAQRGTAVRLLDFEGRPLQSVSAGPLQGRFIVVGWPLADAETTGAVDAAIAEMNKPAIDQLGQSGKLGKLGWCELGDLDVVQSNEPSHP
jgi:hypothetical protein